jgi:hypothetical protein
LSRPIDRALLLEVGRSSQFGTSPRPRTFGQPNQAPSPFARTAL